MADTASPRVVLALDSAGSACSVAVGLGEMVVAEERIDTMHGQAEAMLPLVDKTMREAGQVPAALDLVVATVGPGSFTGVAVEAARSDCSEIRCLLIALESRREDLYVQFFDPLGDPLREPGAIMPFMLGEAVAMTVGARPLLIAGDAAQRASVALAQRANIAVLADSAPGAVGALRAGIRQLRLGQEAEAPRPLPLSPPHVTLPEGPQTPSRART